MVAYLRYWPVLKILGLLFFAFGLNLGTWVSRLVNIKSDLLLTEFELGLLLFFCSLGAILAYPLNRHLMSRYSAVKVAKACFVLLAIVMLALGNSTGFWLYSGLFVLLGLLASVINVHLNWLASGFEQQLKSPLMSSLHALFSLGVFFGALFTLLAEGAEIPYTLQFSVLALGYLLLAAMVSISPPNTSTDNSQKGQHPSVSVVQLTVLGLLVVQATIIEGGINDWAGVYLHAERSLAIQWSSSGLLVFSLFMFVGRCFSDPIRQTVSDAQLLFAAGLVVAACLLTSMYASQLWWSLLGFGGCGLAVAVLAPCIYSLAAKSGATALTMVSSLGAFGGMIGPPAIGLIAQYHSLTKAFVIIAILGFLSSLLCMLLTPPIKPLNLLAFNQKRG